MKPELKTIWEWLQKKKYNRKLIKNYEALGWKTGKLVTEQNFYRWIMEAVKDGNIRTN
ncbi:MAG TPA: hypothetical protein PLE33_05875 [Candidatus Cloacimonas sp.]|nr:hypothetical protein [Candidatus Cloacimonas sp.]